MDDKQIIDLYWARSESAIAETDKKYGKLCHRIAFNILANAQDSEECVSDTYLKAWSVIPPKRPVKLSTFLGKITRNLALNKYEKYSAENGAGEKFRLLWMSLLNVSLILPLWSRWWTVGFWWTSLMYFWKGFLLRQERFSCVGIGKCVPSRRLQKSMVSVKAR